MAKSNVVELEAPAPSKALTVVERAAVALNSEKNRTELTTMVENTKSIIVVKNAAGREQAHGAYMRLKNTRVAIEKASKEARDEANKFSKAVIAEEKTLVEIISAEETRLQTLRDEWDTARAEEKLELERAEAKRQALIQEHIDDIKDIPRQAAGKTAEQIDAIAVDLDFLELTEERFGKRLDEAKIIKIQAQRKLSDMQDAATAAEAAAALAAKQAQEERAERERVAAQQRIEGERLAALQLALEEKAAEQRREQEERDRAAADARAEQDRIAQERRDEADRAAREKRDAAQKILDDREAELRRKREAVEAEERAAQARADAEAAEARRVEQERLDAEAAEKRRLDQVADDARRAEEEAQYAAGVKLRDAAPLLLDSLVDMLEWTMHVPDAWLDATPGLRQQFTEETRAARDAIEAARPVTA